MPRKFLNEKLDVIRLNEIIKLGGTILKVAFAFFIIIGIYAITLILNEWQIFSFIWQIFKTLTPLFIGLFIAWLLSPFVNYLEQKGLNRILGTIMIYIIMSVLLYLLLTSIFPLILMQINEFLTILPSLLETMTNWANKMISSFDEIKIIDTEIIKADILTYINTVITSLATEIPEMIMNLVKGLFSTVGIFAISLIIGFYLLFDFNNISKRFFSICPKKIKHDVQSIALEINTSLLAYIKGTLYISIIIFISSAVMLSLIGVKAPLLLALIIGVTDIIPYIGPYIGAFPAVIIAFTDSATMGILTIVALFFIQVFEGNFIQPLIMSRTMKLHPVSVIVGILIFGYFFGLLGMILATPLVAIIKTIFMFINKKYDILKFIRNNT
ncbi:MAG: AI-2E family transporter [Bacilli bacterium]|jgi:predicted PurR-regulated permease PerM|nr:AI-2E family transporter [Bacilli bacterium]